MDKPRFFHVLFFVKSIRTEFEEEFIFQISQNHQLSECTLEIFLYDWDSSANHRPLGYLQIPVTELGTVPKTIIKSVLRYGTEDKFNPASLGEIMVSLSYQPKASRLNVIVIRARNLFLDDYSTAFEPYVQVSIINKGSILKQKKTNIIHDGTSPVWSENLSFDLSNDIAENIKIDFCVCRGNGQLFGNCQLSKDDHTELFQQVFAGGAASAQWLPLNEPTDIK